MSKQEIVFEADPTDEVIQIKIALCVKSFMKDNKLTRKALADQTNLSELTLRKIALGMEMPKITTVRRLAVIMGNDIIDLLKPIREVKTEEKTEKDTEPEEPKKPIEEFAKLSDFTQRLMLFSSPSLERICNFIIQEIGGSCL